jgi:hypothetical protein
MPAGLRFGIAVNHRLRLWRRPSLDEHRPGGRGRGSLYDYHGPGRRRRLVNVHGRDVAVVGVAVIPLVASGQQQHGCAQGEDRPGLQDVLFFGVHVRLLFYGVVMGFVEGNVAGAGKRLHRHRGKKGKGGGRKTTTAFPGSAQGWNTRRGPIDRRPKQAGLVFVDYLGIFFSALRRLQL